MHAFDFLAASPPLPAVCVAYGDESFLKRLTLKKFRADALGDDDASFSRLEGDRTAWRDVRDELSTFSLFGGAGERRLVLIEEADDFVSKHRAELEDYVARPGRAGILLLEVGAWASNTRLYKAIESSGLQVECRLPEKSVGKRKGLDEDRLLRWLGEYSQRQHQVQLPARAGNVLLELVGTEMGLLDQSIAKLALFVKPGGSLTPELVREVIGGWRAQDIWQLLETAADGRAGDAIKHLGKLLDGGEKPQALFGQISWAFRRYHAALRIVERAQRRGQKADVDAALLAAGFRQWPKEALENARRQLRQLGRQRIGRLYRQLLEIDLALKGSHSRDEPARLMLEQFFVSLSTHADPRAGQGQA